MKVYRHTGNSFDLTQKLICFEVVLNLFFTSSVFKKGKGETRFFVLLHQQLRQFVCTPLTPFYLQGVAVYMSTFTLTAIAIDR